MVATANGAVSWSDPTVTPPSFRARSSSPWGVAVPSRVEEALDVDPLGLPSLLPLLPAGLKFPDLLTR